jgi:GntR family transcriptional regulator of vanillate catabolism
VHRACQLPIIFDSNLRPHNRDASMLLHRQRAGDAGAGRPHPHPRGAGPARRREAEAAMREHIHGHRDLLVYHLRKNATQARATAGA